LKQAAKDSRIVPTGAERLDGSRSFKLIGTQNAILLHGLTETLRDRVLETLKRSAELGTRNSVGCGA
jgi:hypothetical protein